MLLLEEIVRLFDFIGSLVCHRKPDRTLWIGGHYLPVCARDTGAFLGLFLGYTLLLLLRRKEARGPPDLYLSAAMMLPLWVDSLGQLIGLWTSTNDLRLITGLLFGTAVAPMLVYALSLSPFEGKIPVVRGLQPETAILDSRDSWFDAKALLLGSIFSAALFILVRSLVGSGLSLFYWVLSVVIIGGIMWHFFILPSLLLLAVLGILIHIKKVRRVGING